MTEYRMLIGGQLVDTAQHIDVINPATGEVFARVPHATVADADCAIAAAKAAQPAWGATPIAQRRAALNALADAIVARAATN